MFTTIASHDNPWSQSNPSSPNLNDPPADADADANANAGNMDKFDAEGLPLYGSALDGMLKTAHCIFLAYTALKHHHRNRSIPHDMAATRVFLDHYDKDQRYTVDNGGTSNKDQRYTVDKGATKEKHLLVPLLQDCWVKHAKDATRFYTHPIIMPRVERVVAMDVPLPSSSFRNSRDQLRATEKRSDGKDDDGKDDTTVIIRLPRYGQRSTKLPNGRRISVKDSSSFAGPLMDLPVLTIVSIALLVMSLLVFFLVVILILFCIPRSSVSGLN